jgi:hypothetical protein
MFYYFNKKTNETSWDKPKDYVMAADDRTMVRGPPGGAHLGGTHCLFMPLLLHRLR